MGTEFVELKELSSDFGKLYEKTLLNPAIDDFGGYPKPDITFNVEGEKIHAHKTILAIGCSYFNTLLYGEMKEASQDEIVIKDVNASDFKLVVKFLYTGKIDCSNTSIDECIRLAMLTNYYDISNLTNFLERKYSTSINEQNALPCYKMAHHYSLFEETCLEVVDGKAETLLQQGEFLTLPEVCFLYCNKTSVFMLVKLYCIQVAF